MIAHSLSICMYGSSNSTHALRNLNDTLKKIPSNYQINTDIE